MKFTGKFNKNTKQLTMQSEFTINNESFLFNGNLYNYFQLMNEYKLQNNSKTDAEIFFRLLQKKGFKILNEFNADYAFAYVKKDKLLLLCDILGTKPIFYIDNDEQFSFSDKIGGTELLPGTLLELNLKNGKIKLNKRSFFDTQKNFFKDFNNGVGLLSVELFRAISNRVYNLPKFALMFSGGVDSSFIAKVCKDLKCDFTCFVVGTKDSNDVKVAKSVGEELSLDVVEIILTKTMIEKALPDIINIIGDHKPLKVSISIPFYFACKAAKDELYNVILGGLGSEEIFCGYKRHILAKDKHKECYNGLRNLHDRDIYRDYSLTKHFGLDLRCPFLDNVLINTAMRISPEYKIKDNFKKYVFRVIAEQIGVPSAWRKKEATQYGSNSMKLLKELAKNKGFPDATRYLQSIYKKKNCN